MAQKVRLKKFYIRPMEQEQSENRQHTRLKQNHEKEFPIALISCEEPKDGPWNMI